MNISRYELKSAVRTLARHRGFTTVAILSLGLAIGLNTTMYSVLDTLVNPRVDMRRPEQIYRLAYFGDLHRRLPPDYFAKLFRSAIPGVEGTSGSWGMYYNAILEAGDAHANGSVNTVALDYFPLLGVRPTRGRLFTAEDATASTPPAVISEHIARYLFPHGEDPVGRQIVVQSEVYTV